MRILGGARRGWGTPLVHSAAALRSALTVATLVTIVAGCAVATLRPAAFDRDFFPLAPNSQWEYAVSRYGGAERFRFVATVRTNDFHTADGRTCPIVDEQYGGTSGRFPIAYCTESGFLHRIMSLEYRGETLEDNGFRSGELKFLPTDLRHASAWEGVTNAYRLPDGSGFEVQQLHRVLPDAERVEVPAGVFARCVRVETTAIHSAVDDHGTRTGPRVTYYYSDWYAPGVGLVKTEQRSADAAVVATIELVHYVRGARSSS
jgi:hypothetical protein